MILIVKMMMIFIIMITSVIDMTRKSDILSNLDPEVLRLRVEIGCALQYKKEYLSKHLRTFNDQTTFECD